MNAISILRCIYSGLVFIAISKLLIVGIIPVSILEIVFIAFAVIYFLYEIISWEHDGQK